MIKFTKTEKRWLEVIYYLLANYIYSINENKEDILTFLEGYRWTNMFDCDKLKKETEGIIQTVQVCIRNIQQIKRVLLFSNPNCRLKVDNKTLRNLLSCTRYRYNRQSIFKTELVSEVRTIPEPIPRVLTNIHLQIYQFLLALKYMAKITIKMRL